MKNSVSGFKLIICCKDKQPHKNNGSDRWGSEPIKLEECGEKIAMTYDVVVGILCHIPFGLIVAKDMIVTVAECLPPAELCVNVTNDVMVTIL